MNSILGRIWECKVRKRECLWLKEQDRSPECDFLDFVPCSTQGQGHWDWAIGPLTGPRQSTWTWRSSPLYFWKQKKAVLFLSFFFFLLILRNCLLREGVLCDKHSKPPSYGNTALCKWLGSNPIEHNKMKQSVLSPVALIFTMLMIPKTSEQGFFFFKKEDNEEERRHVLLSCDQPSWQVRRAHAYCHPQWGPWEKAGPMLRSRSLHVKQTAHVCAVPVLGWLTVRRNCTHS